jgi:peptidoglycan/LPS O-acetylase OafA/YrhL
VCVIKRILAGLRRVTSSGMYDARIDGLRALAILPVVLFHDALRGNSRRRASDRSTNAGCCG